MKKPKTPQGATRTSVYRKMLLAKRENVMVGLGIKFDTIAKMGRVAEEDQAQLSHDEFVSLRLNSLDYAQLRMVEEALDRIHTGDSRNCLSCEKPSPPNPLQALPRTQCCVSCHTT